jgi:acyl-CoA reductase-like NAD-dependent aldehyde dehydrogenase
MTTLRSINPATGELVGEVPVTPPDAIAAVVERARRAQPAWAALGLDGRLAALRPLGQRLADRARELGALITREMGKPIKEAIGEVKYCGGDDLARDLQDIADALAPETVEDGAVRSTIYRDPYGVCAAITPWNFPVAMPHSLVVPALMAGNAVVLKPSEETPLVGQAYADVVRELLPPDVLQVVHGADAQGKALVAADVELIAFTGSREAGKHILGEAARGLKRVILELGGKDPLIVLEDADLAEAAKFAARNCFRNAGQVCVSTERIYVAAPVANRFVDLLIDETNKLTVGDGADEATRVGPVVNERQRDHVLRQIDDAVSRGAKVAHGGASPRGLFVSPTVLTGVTPDMAIAQQETFGPVACVTAVADEEEAVRRANDTEYGLGAVVFGADERAARVARRLTAGMIGVNRGVGGARGTPWVGARQSGYGFHSSRDGHRQFAQTRVVTTPKR